MSLTSIYNANGPIFLIVFVSLSLTALGIAIWRLIKNFRAHTNMQLFTERLEQTITTGGGQAAYDLCKNESDQEKVVPHIYRTAIEAYQNGQRAKHETREAIDIEVETDILPSLQRGLPMILLFAKVAPMIGLLGTVSGMIQAFNTLADSARVEPAALANDIGMALWTTAEGLVIAIPLIFVYTLFQQQVNRFENEIQRATQDAIVMLPKIFGQG